MRNFCQNFEVIRSPTNHVMWVFVAIGRWIRVIPVKKRFEKTYDHKMVSYEALHTPITLKSR